MHEIYDSPHRSDVGLRQHAMAEIEDVARAPAGSCKDVADLTGTLRSGGEQRGGLEIALDRAISDASPGGIQRDPPVDADDVAARCAEIFQKSGGARARRK